MRHLDFDIEKMGMCIFNIARDEVEAMDFSSIDGLMRMFEANRSTYANDIELLFDGYNEDKRELIEIEEVRNFCKGLLLKYPYIPYFIKSLDGMANILTCAQNFQQFVPKADRFQIGFNINKEVLVYVLTESMEYMRLHSEDYPLEITKESKAYTLANKITDSIGLERIPFEKL